MIDAYIKSHKLTDRLAEEARTTIKSGVKFVEQVLTPISTRLSKISPTIMYRLRRYEFDTKQNIKNWTEIAEPFIKKFNKLPIKERAILDTALKNGQASVIVNSVKRNNMVNEYVAVKELFNTIFRQAKSTGIKLEYRENFFARKVKVGQAEALMETFKGTDQYSKLKEATEGLSEEEKVATINAMLRGYSFNNITLNKPGNFKSRLIEAVTPDIAKYYEDSSDALVDYIISAADAINSKRFFGKKKQGFETLSDTIGEYVSELVESNSLNSEQEQELKEILTARFNQFGTSGIVSTYKNLEYAVTLGQIYNTFTQFGDLYFSVYRFGIKNALLEYGKAAIRKSDINMSDIGLSNIAEEFSSRNSTAKAIAAIFKATGLSYVDKLGKESLINSTLVDAKSKLEKNDSKVNSKLDEMFGNESEQVKKDIINGKKSQNVMFYAFNELSDFQPISLSEVPQKYLSGGNGRIFYMLKTFGLKQLDVYRREAFDNISSGDRKKQVLGLKNLFSLVISMLVINVPVDFIKDMLKGKDFELEDSIIDNLWSIVLFNRYNAQKITRDGLVTVLLRSILPPANLGDKTFKDIADLVNDNKYDISDYESIRNIPVVGEAIYRLLNL